jgi:hypothetical protein
MRVVCLITGARSREPGYRLLVLSVSFVPPPVCIVGGASRLGSPTNDGLDGDGVSLSIQLIPLRRRRSR